MHIETQVQDNQNEIERFMLESWLPVAEKHAQGSNGEISVLDIDPALYPAQRLDTYHVAGNPQSPEVVEIAANLVEPHFTETSRKLSDSVYNTVILDQVGSLLESGDNVILVTNHMQLTDVAIAQAGVYSYLKREGCKFNTSLIMSKMISLLASNAFKDETGQPIPGVKALEVICDDAYLSYPKSETTSKTAIAQTMPEVIRSHNMMVSQAILQKLGEGGVLLAMCPSGTTDTFRDNGSTCVMHRVQSGTARIMAHKKSFVLPMATYFGEQNAFMKVSKDIQRVSSQTDTDIVMQSIAKTLDNEVPDINFIYK